MRTEDEAIEALANAVRHAVRKSFEDTNVEVFFPGIIWKTHPEEWNVDLKIEKLFSEWISEWIQFYPDSLEDDELNDPVEWAEILERIARRLRKAQKKAEASKT